MDSRPNIPFFLCGLLVAAVCCNEPTTWREKSASRAQLAAADASASMASRRGFEDQGGKISQATAEPAFEDELPADPDADAAMLPKAGSGAGSPVPGTKTARETISAISAAQTGAQSSLDTPPTAEFPAFVRSSDLRGKKLIHCGVETHVATSAEIRAHRSILGSLPFNGMCLNIEIDWVQWAEEGQTPPEAPASSPNHSSRWVSDGGGASLGWFHDALDDVLKRRAGANTVLRTEDDPLQGRSSYTIEFRARLPAWTDPRGVVAKPLVLENKRRGATPWRIEMGRHAADDASGTIRLVSGSCAITNVGGALGDRWHLLRLTVAKGEAGGTMTLYHDGSRVGSCPLPDQTSGGAAIGDDGLHLFADAAGSTFAASIDHIRISDSVVPPPRPNLNGAIETADSDPRSAADRARAPVAWGSYQGANGGLADTAALVSENSRTFWRWTLQSPAPDAPPQTMATVSDPLAGAPHHKVEFEIRFRRLSDSAPRASEFVEVPAFTLRQEGEGTQPWRVEFLSSAESDAIVPRLVSLKCTSLAEPVPSPWDWVKYRVVSDPSERTVTLYQTWEVAVQAKIGLRALARCPLVDNTQGTGLGLWLEAGPGAGEVTVDLDNLAWHRVLTDELRGSSFLKDVAFQEGVDLWPDFEESPSGPAADTMSLPRSVRRSAENYLAIGSSWGRLQYQFIHVALHAGAGDPFLGTAVNLDRSSDRERIRHVAAVIGRFAKVIGASGLFFDTEPFEGSPFENAAVASVRLSGKEWIEILQRELPSVKTMFTFIFCPDAICDVAKNFALGMLDGIQGKAELISNYENTQYWGLGSGMFNDPAIGVPGPVPGTFDKFRNYRAQFDYSYFQKAESHPKFVQFVQVGGASWWDHYYNMWPGWTAVTGWNNLPMSVASGDEYTYVYSSHMKYLLMEAHEVDPYLLSVVNRTLPRALEKTTTFDEGFGENPLQNGWYFDFDALAHDVEAGNAGASVTNASVMFRMGGLPFYEDTLARGPGNVVTRTRRAGWSAAAAQVRVRSTSMPSETLRFARPVARQTSDSTFDMSFLFSVKSIAEEIKPVITFGGLASECLQSDSGMCRVNSPSLIGVRAFGAQRVNLVMVGLNGDTLINAEIPLDVPLRSGGSYAITVRWDPSIDRVWAKLYEHSASVPTLIGQFSEALVPGAVFFVDEIGVQREIGPEAAGEFVFDLRRVQFSAPAKGLDAH